MQIKPNYITIFSFFLSMSIGSCNCKKDAADGDKNKIHSAVNSTPNSPTSNPPTSNPPASNPPASNPPTSNPPTSNPPTSNPPASNPPTSNPPTSNPPTSNPPTSNPPTSNPPTTTPPTSNPTSNPAVSNPATTNLPTSNPTSNPISTSSSSSADDSSDSKEDAKSNSTLLPPLQNPSTSVNNNKPADNSSAMPITDEMIQTIRSSVGSDAGKTANRRAFADSLEKIKSGTVQVGDLMNDWYTLFDGSRCHLIVSAIVLDRLDILEALVELGAGVVMVTSKGENALNAACRYGKLEAVKFLFTLQKLKSTAFSSSVSERNTNLMAAVKSKNLAVVQYVWNETMKLTGGSEFFSMDMQADFAGKTPLEQAKADGSQAIVDFLLSKGFKV